MQCSWRGRPSGDDGVALIYALAIIGLVGIMMVTLVGLSISDGKQTGRDRARAQAVTSAEGAVDLALAQLQEADLADVPCGGTTTNVEAQPDAMAITTTVQFYDAAGTPLSCPPPDDVVATQAVVQASSVATPAGAGSPATRTIETLVQLAPKFANDLDKAIFGNAGVVIGQRSRINGEGGLPNADVYTNGDFACANNQNFQGSVLAQGSISMANSCTIEVDAWAADGFSMSSPQGRVGGDVRVSGGIATIGSGSVGGKVKALDVRPDSWCTANPAKCVEGVGATSPPSAQAFPQLKGDNATIAVWQSEGFQVVNLNGCSANNTTNPARWIMANGPGLTAKTLIRTPCRLSFPSSANTISLAQDLAVFADGGITLDRSLTFQSTNSTIRSLYLIHPYDFASRISATCSSLNPGVSLSQQVQMTATLKELLYSPCNVSKNNQGVLTGQVYGGGTVDMGQQTNLTYSPLEVFGVVSQNIVESYTADVLYKRENTT